MKKPVLLSILIISLLLFLIYYLAKTQSEEWHTQSLAVSHGWKEPEQEPLAGPAWTPCDSTLSAAVNDDAGLLYRKITRGWAGGAGSNCTYYNNGRLKSEYYFKQACIVQFRKYDEDGQLLGESHSESCWDDRTDREYYKSGQLKRETVYRYNRILSNREYNAEGQLIENFALSSVHDD